MIKTAYKKLALVSKIIIKIKFILRQKWHPDKNNGSEESTEMFKKISEAYAILSNPDRRKKYDLYGYTEDDGDLGDMFSEMFGKNGP